MSRYGLMKRPNRNRIEKSQLIDTQKKFVRGILLLILSTLLIVFILGDHGLFQLMRCFNDISRMHLIALVILYYIIA